MSERIDLTDVILKQATLISLYVVCYYSVFYVIKFIPEKCIIKLKSTVCILDYTSSYGFFIFFLFAVLVLYAFKILKGSVSKEIENQVYLLIFLAYFTVFEISVLIFTMHLNYGLSILAWLNIPIVLFCGYFYASLKIIYSDLKKVSNKDIAATIFGIILLFALNIFGFLQAKEQAYDAKKKYEQEVQKI